MSVTSLLALAGPFSPGAVAIIAVIGLVAGVLGGLFGIGGGLVMIPALLLLVPNPFGPNALHVYKLASLATSVVLSVPAVIRHAQHRAIVPRMVLAITPIALAGVLAGVVAAGFLVGPQTRLLRQIFGGFMLLAVGASVYRRLHVARSGVATCPVPTRWARVGLIVGLPSGLISGLLGVGGGVWAVPAQNLALGIRLQNAIANSACMILFVTALAAGLQSAALGQIGGVSASDGWRIAAWLAPGALVGGWVGAKLTHILSAVWLYWLFQVLLVVAAVKLLLGT